MDLIKITDLSFTYPNSSGQALENINLLVKSGQFVLITGPSGCGKTTLLKQLKKSLLPYGKKEGQVLYKDCEIEKVADKVATEEIGYVFQNPENQIVTNRVDHELAFGLENLGKSQADMERRIGEIANYFGITSWIDRETSNLSGGEKQILNLASVIAMEPELVLLDEPTSQLDPIAAGRFMDLLRRVHEELGITIILSEHRIEDVYGIADCVIRMNRGHIIGTGSPEDMAWECRLDSLDYPTATRIWAGYKEETSKPPMTVGQGRQFLKNISRIPLGRGTDKNTNTVLREISHSSDDKKLGLVGKGLHFRYGMDTEEILKGCDIEVALGRIQTIVGGNGSGKSTLLRILAGVIPADRGKYICFGQRVKSMKDIRRGMDGIVLLPQDPKALFHGITVEEELREMLPVPKDEAEDLTIRANLQDLLKRLDLLGLENSHPYDLSGGEAQRLALGKLLLLNPRILLLDEPTKGLDPDNRRKLGRMLQELAADGKGIILVTHNLEFAATYSDSITMLFDGRLTNNQSPKDFFSKNRFYTTAAARMSYETPFQGITVEGVQEVLYG